MNQFIKYTFFGILGMLGLSAYIIADTFFVSKGLGSQGLTALNLAIPVYSFIHGTGLLLGIGGATKYAIYKGQKNKKQMNIVFTNTLYSMIFCSLLFEIIGFLLSERLCLFLGADNSVLSMTNTYVRMLLLFSPAFLLNNGLICFVRNDGKPQLSMAAMLFGSFSNIILDYIFIFPLQMGIFGAVFATVLAPILSILLLLFHCFSKTREFHIIKGNISLDSIKWIFLMGFPSFVAQLSSGIVMITFNKIILALQGNIGVAAYGVIANLSLVMVAVFSGMEQGIQPLFSQYYGRKEYHNVTKVLKYSLIMMLICSFIIYGITFYFTEDIIQIFNSENNLQMKQIALSGLKLYFIATVFVGLNTVLSIFFTSTEKVIFAHIISLLRGFIFILPMIFLLSALWQMTGVWLSYAVTEGLVSVLTVFLFYKQKKTP